MFEFIYKCVYFLLLFYFAWVNIRCRLPKDIAKKYKQICKMEDRTTVDQEKRIIKEFIKTYENTHNLRWDENNQRYE